MFARSEGSRSFFSERGSRLRTATSTRLKFLKSCFVCFEIGVFGAAPENCADLGPAGPDWDAVVASEGVALMPKGPPSLKSIGRRNDISTMPVPKTEKKIPGPTRVK